MPSATPKLTVIVVAHDNETTIEQCLTSVLQQSLQDVEVLCAGWKCADESQAIAYDLATEDERLVMLGFGHDTASEALNEGLAAAKGDYIHFMSAGDYVLDYAYEALLNKMRRYDLDCVKFSSIVFDESQGTTVLDERLALSALREGDFNRVFARTADEQTFLLPVEAWTGVYRRALLEERGIRFCPLADAYDKPFFLRVVTTAQRVAAARDRLVVHRVQGPNITPSPLEQLELLSQDIEALQAIETAFQADGVAPEIAEQVLRGEYDEIVGSCEALSLDEECGMMAVSLVDQLLQGTTHEYLHDALMRMRDIRKAAAWRDEQLKEARELLARGESLPANLAALIKGSDAAKPGSTPPLPRTSVFFKESKAPKVSVVVPVYNQEEYLNQALHSLTEQLLKDIEFICVNDGSTDESMTILREYANVDKRFRIIDKQNTGYGNTMNVGMDAARGEYIGILEPDDFVPPKMFRNLYNLAAKNDLDFVKANFYRFWDEEDGSTRLRKCKLTRDSSFYKRVVNPSEELDTFMFVMNTWSGIYKRSFLTKWNIRHNETPGASYQDNGFWFQTFARATRAWFAMTPYYMNRRDNPNSSMFDKGKFYAVTNEYQFLEDWLRANPDITEKYERILYRKKFGNFVYTYYRLAREHKREYLHHMRDEFAPLMEAGKIDEKLFGPANMKMLADIIADPDAFCDKLRVSVVIPAYNAQDYIRTCLDSILVRDEIRTEVICVDDGSTDDTLSILREYEQRDPRVRVIVQENAGAGAARNNGMQYASGEYLAFLDADDFFEPDMLRRAYEKAYGDDADVVVFRSDNYNEDTKTYTPLPYSIQKKLLPNKSPFCSADVDHDVFKLFVGWPWDKLFRTEFVTQNGLTFQEQRTTNDLLFVFSAIVRAQRISTMGAVMAHHRRLQAGASLSVTRERSWDCFYRALCALREQLREWGLYEQLEQDFINYALHSCLWNINSLKGESYHLLYDKLKGEWLDDLGVTGKGALYFYNAGEYSQLQNLLEQDAEEYLFGRFDAMKANRDELKREIGGLNKEIAALTKESDGLRKRLETAQAKNATLREKERKASQKLKAATDSAEKAKEQADKVLEQAGKVMEQADKAKEQADKVKESNSYKVGRAATWLPRKVSKELKSRKNK